MQTDKKTATAADTPSPDTETVLGSVQDVERAVEAILFAAGYPVAYEKLSEVIGLSQRDLRNLISRMAENYEDRGIQLLMYPDTCQLCTKEIFGPYIREALGIKRGGNLSNSSLEALAVVAYNQPVTRSFVDTVRGVDSSYAVTSLLDKGLIEAIGRLEAPGRPMLYATTEKFLRVFGLNSLADLPETEALGVAEAAQTAQAMATEIDPDQLAIESSSEASADGQGEPAGLAEPAEPVEGANESEATV